MEDSKLYNYLRGKTTEEENKQIEEWYNESEENRKTLETLYYTLFVGDRLEDMNNVNVNQMLNDFKNRVRQEQPSQKIIKLWRKYAAIAAAFIIGVVAMGGIGAYILSGHESKYVVTTESDEKVKVLLPDGSQVWVNSSSKLVYSTSLFSTERNVSLIGEAFFKVAKDKKLPFVVNSKSIKTRVYGTEFNVKAQKNDDRVITTLYEGSVAVQVPDESEEQTYQLLPGQQIEVNSNTYAAKLSKFSTGKGYPLWMSGKFHFDQATLFEISRALEKHYNVHIIFLDENLKQERFTCEFYKDEGLDSILTVLKLTRWLDYDVKNHNVYLSRKKK